MMPHETDNPLGLARGRVELRPYDRRWPALFTEEAARLREALGERIGEIEHIGSTAVPGLIAKPLLDMMASMTALPAPEEVKLILRRLGYEERGDGGVEGRSLFAKGPPERRTHMLSLCLEGEGYWRAQIAFRNYLCAHPEALHEYARLKKRLAAMHSAARPLYTEGKSGFVAKILALA